MDNDYTIDSHSHICFETDKFIVGSNYMWDIVPTLDKYQKLASKNNIGITLFSPCTSPEIINKDSKEVERFIVWNYINGKYKYYHEFCDSNGKIYKLPLENNPYEIINYKINEYLQDYSDYYFVPAINLMFDTQEYISDLIMKGVPAFKCHGISVGLDSFDKIDKRLLKLLSKYDIPLVIHTDYSRNDRSPIEKLYRTNSPLEWIKLLRKYDIRGYLVHGCRLSIECANILEKCKGQFMAGISPDLLLNNEQERLFINTDDYLKSLLDMYSDDVLCFDIDYGWNVEKRNSREIDMNQLERISKLFTNDVQKQKILRKNSENFFKVKKSGK